MDIKKILIKILTAENKPPLVYRKELPRTLGSDIKKARCL